MTTTASPATRWIRLFIATIGLAMIWLVLLPFLASRPSVAEHIATQQQLNVDPSAMFYSELEIAPSIGHRAERLMDANSKAFWGRQSATP